MAAGASFPRISSPSSMFRFHRSTSKADEANGVFRQVDHTIVQVPADFSGARQREFPPLHRNVYVMG